MSEVRISKEIEDRVIAAHRQLLIPEYMTFTILNALQFAANHKEQFGKEQGLLWAEKVIEEGL